MCTVLNITIGIKINMYTLNSGNLLNLIESVRVVTFIIIQTISYKIRTRLKAQVCKRVSGRTRGL